MKFAILIVTAFLLISSIAASADETCRFIDKRAEREACYTRQEEARAAKLKAQEEAKRATAYSPPLADDQNMFRTLHSICRGC